jgi:hypothetical protein
LPEGIERSDPVADDSRVKEGLEKYYPKEITRIKRLQE